jgi:hypothetical protein
LFYGVIQPHLAGEASAPAEPTIGKPPARDCFSRVVQALNHFTVFSPNTFLLQFHRDFTDHSIEVR